MALIRDIARIRGAIADMLTESITITSNTGRTAYGPVDATDTVELWYMEPTTKRVTNAQGQEVVASLFGIGPDDSVAAVGDKVVYGTGTYRIVQIQPLRPGGVVSHVEAYFTSAVTA